MPTRHPTRWIVLALALSGVHASRLDAQSPAATAASRIGELLGQYAHLGQLSGAVLVAEGGRVVYRGAFDHADRELDVAMQPTHRFLIGSNTKAFTAMVVLQEVAAGRIALDSAVRTYWPEFPDPSGGLITVRQLLAHRSGLRHYGAIDGFLENDARLVQDRVDVIRRFAAEGLTFPPGGGEGYSSIGYLTLGVMLETLTDSSLADLYLAHIFAPLGMTSSSLDDGTTVVPGRVRAYRYSFLDAEYQNAEYRDPSTTWSTGGILTTVNDLRRWGEALLANRLLPDSLMALLWDPAEGAAAYGWRRDVSDTSAIAFYHEGLVTGYRSEITLVPSRGQVIVVLGNLRDMDVQAIIAGIRMVLAGEKPVQPRLSLMKEVLRASARGGGQMGARRFREILEAGGAGYDTTTTEGLLAAIELRNGDACGRAAPIFDAWIARYPGSPYVGQALADAADCWLRADEPSRAAPHIGRLEALKPGDAAVAALRRRLRGAP